MGMGSGKSAVDGSTPICLASLVTKQGTYSSSLLKTLKYLLKREGKGEADVAMSF